MNYLKYRAKMAEYLALAESAITNIRGLAPVIQREVDRRWGRKIQAARTTQERDNLRQYYTRQVSRENLWRAGYVEDRALYISLATMYGIAALVEAQQTLATYEPEVF